MTPPGLYSCCSPSLQFEAASALSNIAAGTSVQAQAVVREGKKASIDLQVKHGRHQFAMSQVTPHAEQRMQAGAWYDPGTGATC